MIDREHDLPITKQAEVLLQEGCDEVQGYLTGRPLPITPNWSGVKQSFRRITRW